MRVDDARRVADQFRSDAFKSQCGPQHRVPTADAQCPGSNLCGTSVRHPSDDRSSGGDAGQGPGLPAHFSDLRPRTHHRRHDVFRNAESLKNVRPSVADQIVAGLEGVA